MLIIIQPIVRWILYRFTSESEFWYLPIIKWDSQSKNAWSLSLSTTGLLWKQSNSHLTNLVCQLANLLLQSGCVDEIVQSLLYKTIWSWKNSCAKLYQVAALHPNVFLSNSDNLNILGKKLSYEAIGTTNCRLQHLPLAPLTQVCWSEGHKYSPTLHVTVWIQGSNIKGIPALHFPHSDESIVHSPVL